MNDSLAKLISSGLKYLVGLIVGFLVGAGLLTKEASEQFSSELISVVVPLAGVVAALITAVIQAWWNKRSGGGSGGASGGSAAASLLILCTAASMAGLPSCRALSEYPVTGSLFYRDPESGAKAAIDFKPGSVPRAKIAVPQYDEQGRLTGYVELSGPLAAEVTPSSK